MNGETAKNLKVDLAFLGKGNYQATLMEDDQTSTEKTVITHKILTATNSISLNLQQGGGFAAKLMK